MLLIRRKLDQHILVGSNIVITVAKLSGHVVQLGISAPTDVPIYRDNLYDQLQREDAANGIMRPTIHEILRKSGLTYYRNTETYEDDGPITRRLHGAS